MKFSNMWTSCLLCLLLATPAWAGNIDLSWIAPAEREDGTALSLSEIAGYTIYYGTTSSVYDTSLFINDHTATSHTFEDFAPDEYYFVITTIDTEDRESVYSNEIITDISITLFPPKPVSNLTLSIGII